MRISNAKRHVSSISKFLISQGALFFLVLLIVPYATAQAGEKIGAIELKREYSIDLGPAWVKGTVTGSIPLNIYICAPNEEFELRGEGSITSSRAVGGGCICKGGGQANVSFKGYLFEPCEIRVSWFEAGGESMTCSCPGSSGPYTGVVEFPLHPIYPFPLEIKDGDTHTADRDWPSYEMTSEFTLHLDVPADALNRMLVLRRLVNDPKVDSRWTADEYTIDDIELPWQAWHFLSHLLKDLREEFASICKERQNPFSYMLVNIDGPTLKLAGYFYLQDQQGKLSPGRKIIWDWIRRRLFDPESVWFTWGGGDQCKSFSTGKSSKSHPWIPLLLLED